MKMGEALRTQASSLYSATPIGAPMYPAPIGVAERARKNNFWRTVSGQHYPLAERVIGAPIYWRNGQNCQDSEPIARRGGGQGRKRRTKHFGAPHLFSHQSPINWALQKGNGNTSKKR